MNFTRFLKVLKYLVKHYFNFFYQTKIHWGLTKYSDFFLSYELKFVLYLNKIIIFRLKN